MDVLKLLDAALFNTIIGNADAHAKNFSLLCLPDRTELAPLYDLLSTVACPDLGRRLAMKIGGRRTFEELYPADLEKFAKEIEIRAPFVRRRLAEVASAILEQADNVVLGPDLPPMRLEIAEAIKEIVLRRADLALSRLKT